MSGNYIFPIEKPLSGGAFDLCDGPGGRWAAVVASAGIRVGRWTGQVMDDSFGSANNLFTAGERPSKLSICFDLYVRQVIAIQRDAANVEVRYFTQSDIGPVPISADMDTITADTTSITADNETAGSLVTLSNIFPGKSPVVVFNQNGVNDDTQCQVIVFYLKDDGQEIFARVISEDFANEYQINGGLPALAKLSKAEVKQIGGAWYLLLWGITKDGRQVYFRSGTFPIVMEEGITLDATVIGSSYFVPPGAPPNITDGITEDATLSSGVYAATVVTATKTDALTEDASLNSGLYQNTVVPESGPSDATTENATLVSGSYA